ncbi:MAG: dihydrolipoyl dehydrogenase [SAR324 cluster bacterium]|nr:dihydrolipoyl dehydrogenase [SAR324 cluster bacterium]
MKHYDIIVIGSGGGAKISTPSSKLGYKVALIEKGPLGGTCLNRGCIPSKMLIHAADVAQTIEDAHQFQILPKGFDVDFPTLVHRVADVIDAESLSINPAIEANPNIDLYPHHAQFSGDKRLKIGDEEITGEKIFIAAGARPLIPNIPGLSEVPYITSTEALRLDQFPKKMVVIGGGYIATELSHYFRSLGTEIHMFVRSRLLKEEDSEVSEEFSKVFGRRHHIYLRNLPSEIKHSSGKFQVFYNDQEGKSQSIDCDQVFVAAGVVPNSDLLDLEKTGVQVNEKGFIKVDGHLKTTADNIWAFGDIAGNFLFRHSANFEGQYLFASVIHQAIHDPIDYTGMPHAVFSHPQIAGVGEREDDLKARGANYVKGVNPYSSSAMGMALRSNHGFVKLLVEKGTHQILGCHIIGHEASTLIHQIIPLIRLKGKLEDLLYMIHIHPALSEIVRNAARKARDQLMEAGEELPIELKIA